MSTNKIVKHQNQFTPSQTPYRSSFPTPPNRKITPHSIRKNHKQHTAPGKLPPSITILRSPPQESIVAGVQSSTSHGNPCRHYIYTTVPGKTRTVLFCFLLSLNLAAYVAQERGDNTRGPARLRHPRDTRKSEQRAPRALRNRLARPACVSSGGPGWGGGRFCGISGVRIGA